MALSRWSATGGAPPSRRIGSGERRGWLFPRPCGSSPAPHLPGMSGRTSRSLRQAATGSMREMRMLWIDSAQKSRKCLIQNESGLESIHFFAVSEYYFGCLGAAPHPYPLPLRRGRGGVGVYAQTPLIRPHLRSARFGHRPALRYGSGRSLLEKPNRWLFLTFGHRASPHKGRR